MIQNSSINIITLNVCSLIGLDRRVFLLEMLLEYKPDFCFVGETRLNKRYNLILDKHRILRNDTGQGTAIIFRNDINVTQLDTSFSQIPLTLAKGFILEDNTNPKSILIGSI